MEQNWKHHMEELIDINGKNLCVKTLGAGKPLLFLHSSLLTSEMWDKQIEYFSKSHLTITYDFCGHGKSELPEGSYSDFDDLKTIIDRVFVIICYKEKRKWKIE